MKATIDQSGCISCGLCAGMCPEVFEMGPDGLAQVLAAPTAQTIEAAKDAADSCPVAVISVEK